LDADTVALNHATYLTLFHRIFPLLERTGKKQAQWKHLDKTGITAIVSDMCSKQASVLRGWKLLAFFWKRVKGYKKAKGRPRKSEQPPAIFHMIRPLALDPE
jgi:hypothetical protein